MNNFFTPADKMRAETEKNFKKQYDEYLIFMRKAVAADMGEAKNNGIYHVDSNFYFDNTYADKNMCDTIVSELRDANYHVTVEYIPKNYEYAPEDYEDYEDGDEPYAILHISWKK